MPERLVVFLPNWIGDVVMATPALRAIRNHFPRANTQIIGVMKPYVASVLAGTPWIDQTIQFRGKGTGAWRRSWALSREMRRLRPDVAVYMPNSLRPAVIGWLSGCRERIGYARNGRGLLLTKRIDWPQSNGKAKVVSALDVYLELAYALGCPPESKRMELAVTPHDVQQAEQIWQEVGLTEYARVILLNLGSANGAARHWPMEHYLQLCSRLASDTDTGILVICGPAEEDAARQIEAAMGHPQVKSMAGRDLSLGVSKACIARASLMVSPDSGPRHIAAAFDVPTITLSGPIHPLVGANYHPDAIVLHEQLPCQPCGLDTCPIKGHPCMRNLTPERVHAEILRLLDRRARQAA